MIHRFVDTHGTIARIIPYVLHNDTRLLTSLWMNKHGVGPAELMTTRLSTAINSPRICDPQLSPDEQDVVYAVIPGTGTTNSIQLIPADGSANPATVATSPNANNTPQGIEASMEPYWHPDGSKILYRSTTAGSVGSTTITVRTVLPNGTGDTALITFDINTEGRPYWPTYNYDGSRIAMVMQSFSGAGSIDLAVMDADGSNWQVIANIFNTSSGSLARTPFAWANTQDVIAFYDWTADEVHLINGDGTGDTTIYTDPDPSWGVMKVTWLLDDSEIVYSQFDSGASAPKYDIGTLDPGGGGFTAISPSRKWYGQGQNGYPRLFPQDGRIWWQEGDTTSDIVVSSVLPNGSDYAVEHDVDDTDYSWGTGDGFSYHG